MATAWSNMRMKKLAIIGGGPSALMLAAQIDTDVYDVTLYEKKKAVGRKFLVAGEGGLNLTYNAPLKELSSSYVPKEFMTSIISQFTNEDLRSWCEHHGVKSFVGSSSRVFPDSKLKPIDVLNKMVKSVRANEVKFALEAEWTGWNDKGELSFEGADDAAYDRVVFALGGASWKVTGSDGLWSKYFEEKGVVLKPFRAANCAFSVSWNKNFLTTHEGKPLKNVAMIYDKQYSKGELTISKFGLEGNALYALSEKIQKTLLSEDSATVYLDLKPTMTVDQIKAKFNSTKLAKTTEILKEVLNLDRASVGVLKQWTDKETFLNSNSLAAIIKSVPVTVNAADEIDKAISTTGGIAIEAIDENFQLKKIQNAYAIGEMVDWYAPTGGYLLQACFSMGFVLAEYLNELA